MSHPNGDQPEPFHPPAATSEPPSSFQESATQFTASAFTTASAPAVPEQAPSWAPVPAVEPATQPVYTHGAATVPAVPAASPVPGNGFADPALPVPVAHGYTPGYAAESGTSAFPVTGVPVSGYPMMAVPPKKKRTGTVILTVATIVLGLATAGFGTMYFLEASAHTKADKKVSEQTALLADADTKIKETESKLSTAKEENAKLNQDLTGAKNKTDEVTKARDALAACMAASDAYVANKNSSTARDVIVKCSEAEKYY